MKNIIGLIAICVATAATSFPTLAQQPAAAPQDPQCTQEAKTAVYGEVLQHIKGDQAKANELAKKWLACPEIAGEEKITPYLKNFVTKYEKAIRKDQVTILVYSKKEYPKAFEVGRAVLADEPENLKVLIDLAYAGFAAATDKNEAFVGDAMSYAKKAMPLIEAGKAPEKWEPYLGKDDALAYLNNIIGRLTAQSNAGEALPYLIKVAQYESKLKKLPSTYGIIGVAYETGPYAKLSEAYKRDFGGKDETPESKLALENVNQVVDRMIDAYARAVALVGTDASQAAAKKEWMESLSTWYKYRHTGTEDGLPEMLASILTKPLPPVPTPITTLPAAAPASTPTSGAVSATGASAGNGTTSATATSQPSAMMNNSATSKTAPAAKSTTPAKPR